MTKDYCDRIHLIRSIQRMEGKDDCFGEKFDECDRVRYCPWGEFCGQIARSAAVTDSQPAPE